MYFGLGKSNFPTGSPGQGHVDFQQFLVSDYWLYWTEEGAKMENKKNPQLIRPIRTPNTSGTLRKWARLEGKMAKSGGHSSQRLGTKITFWICFRGLIKRGSFWFSILTPSSVQCNVDLSYGSKPSYSMELATPLYIRSIIWKHIPGSKRKTRDYTTKMYIKGISGFQVLKLMVHFRRRCQ